MQELLDRMADELEAAISFLEDKSKSERRRLCCLASFKATLEEYNIQQDSRWELKR